MLPFRELLHARKYNSQIRKDILLYFKIFLKVTPTLLPQRYERCEEVLRRVCNKIICRSFETYEMMGMLTRHVKIKSAYFVKNVILCKLYLQCSKCCQHQHPRASPTIANDLDL